jgi:hypothetical protein
VEAAYAWEHVALHSEALYDLIAWDKIVVEAESEMNLYARDKGLQWVEEDLHLQVDPLIALCAGRKVSPKVGRTPALKVEDAVASLVEDWVVHELVVEAELRPETSAAL